MGRQPRGDTGRRREQTGVRTDLDEALTNRMGGERGKKDEVEDDNNRRGRREEIEVRGGGGGEQSTVIIRRVARCKASLFSF